MSENLLEAMKETTFEKHPAVSFPKVGDTCSGVIVGKPRKTSTTDMNDSSKEIPTFIFDISLSQPCITGPEGEQVTTPAGEIVTLWVKKQMATALVEAAKKSGAKNFEEGGTLTVRLDSLKKSQKNPGFKPQKIYKAAYKAPVPAMAVDELGADDDDDEND